MCRLPWTSSFPRSGLCCVFNTPRGFLYLSAGIAVIGGHVRLFPPQKKKYQHATSFQSHPQATAQAAENVRQSLLASPLDILLYCVSHGC